MAAKYILTALAVLFLLGGATVTARSDAGQSQGRTWLLTGGIFGIVSLYLWWRT